MTDMTPTTITLTETEARALLALLDIAVKAGGLQVAQDAVFFQQKLVAAFAPAKETKSE